MLTIEEFTSKMLCQLKAEVPEGVRVIIQNVEGNNGIRIRTVAFINPAVSLVPSVPVRDLYSLYKKGSPLEHLSSHLIEELVPLERKDGMTQDLPPLLSLAQNKEKIYPRLINRERNEEKLKDLPHRPYMDLAVIYYAGAKTKEGDLRSAVISRSFMESMGLTEEELHDLALRNLMQGDVLMRDIRSIQLEICGEAIPSEDEWTGEPVLVITNPERPFGAAEILREGVLKEAAEILQGDFFLLPSSIHEVILKKGQGWEDADALRQMVREINCTVVKPEEILSDSVYFYSRSENRLMKV